MDLEVVLLTTSEVAEVFRVDRTTITRWVMTGRLKAIALPGRRGLLRYRKSDIEAILAAEQPPGATA
jgi:excisionase family DNA binding protein